MCGLLDTVGDLDLLSTKQNQHQNFRLYHLHVFHTPGFQQPYWYKDLSVIDTVYLKRIQKPMRTVELTGRLLGSCSRRSGCRDLGASPPQPV